VITRAVFSYTVPSNDEVVVIGFVWAVFIGCAAAYKRKMHYGVDLLVNLFPKSVKHVISVITGFMAVCLNAYFAYLSWVLAEKAITKVFPGLQISYFWADLAMVVGFGMMTVYAVIQLVETLKQKPIICWEEETVGGVEA